MSAVCHHGHKTNLHNGWTPGAVQATASNFTVNGQPIARVGDTITDHPHTGSSPPHKAATIVAGAPRFTVGGIAVARVDDPTSCGGKMAEGESSFTIGD